MTEATGRLVNLYDIAKLLARFESIERTVPRVLARMSESAPLRTAVLLLEEGAPASFARTRTFVWHADGASPSRVGQAENHARTAYSYLVRSAPRFEAGAGTTRFPTPMPPPPESSAPGFVLLPLVVDRGRVFGALHLEGMSRLSESDLGFVNATVNQLSVAIDRVTAVAANEATAKASQAAAELLDHASAVLFASLEYKQTLAAVVRAALPQLGDVCILDELHENGRIERVEVRAVDPRVQPFVDRIKSLAPTSDSPAVQAEVLRSGESILIEVKDVDSFSGNAEHAELLKSFGVHSMMVVPLLARGRTLGALTFAATRPELRYCDRELDLAREIGVRASIALDNARLYARAQHAIEARQRLIAIVSHDLKNPLGTILMSAGLMLKWPSAGAPEPWRSRVEVIQRSAHRMNRLLADLLDMTSMEMGRLSVVKAAQDVAPIVLEAVEVHAPAAAKKGLRLESRLPEDPYSVDCDRDRILQILGNLIGNAVKFTEAGGTIQLSARLSGGQVVFSVADNGPGIAPDDLHSVFDRHWQATKTASLGTGFGLSICKGLVELHGGHIWVEATPGGGATFRFTLPATATRSSRAGAESTMARRKRRRPRSGP